jgi:hypothetical protein
MKRKPNSKSQASAMAMLSATVFMAAGASATAQAPKAAPTGQKAPAAPQGLPQPTPVGSMDKVDRGSAHIKFAAKLHKDWGQLSMAGMLDGQPVFKNAQGEYFQVEPNTGDLKFHTAESLGFMKYDPKGKAAATRAATFIKFDYIKVQQRVSLLGVDAQGHVLQENSRGERFYLGPNGDMVFVK